MDHAVAAGNPLQPLAGDPPILHSFLVTAGQLLRASESGVVAQPRTTEQRIHALWAVEMRRRFAERAAQYREVLPEPTQFRHVPEDAPALPAGRRVRLPFNESFLTDPAVTSLPIRWRGRRVPLRDAVIPAGWELFGLHEYGEDRPGQMLAMARDEWGSHVLALYTAACEVPGHARTDGIFDPNRRVRDWPTDHGESDADLVMWHVSAALFGAVHAIARGLDPAGEVPPLELPAPEPTPWEKETTQAVQEAGDDVVHMSVYEHASEVNLADERQRSLEVLKTQGAEILRDFPELRQASAVLGPVPGDVTADSWFRAAIRLWEVARQFGHSIEETVTPGRVVTRAEAEALADIEPGILRAQASLGVPQGGLPTVHGLVREPRDRYGAPLALKARVAQWMRTHLEGARQGGGVSL